MLPRWHILFGALFSLVVFFLFPGISWFHLSLIFLSSFLIDFDHYVVAVGKTGKWLLRDSYKYYEVEGRKADALHKKCIRKVGPLQFFHTIEFHLLVFVLGFLWSGFFYVFVGMLFHSLFDVMYMIKKDLLYQREFIFARWLCRKIR